MRSVSGAPRDEWSLAVDMLQIVGTLRRDADVGFTTCPRGHRIVVRRVGRTRTRLLAPDQAD